VPPSGLVLKHPLDLPWVVPDKSALCRYQPLAAATAGRGDRLGKHFSWLSMSPSILAASKLLMLCGESPGTHLTGRVGV
jgi:hypothetical protein